MAEQLASRLEEILKSRGAALWGFADVAGLPPGNLGHFPRAVSFAFAMEPTVMAGLKNGPTREYTLLYQETNARIDSLAGELSEAIRAAGFVAKAIHSSFRSDPVNIRGDFPHKTAATRAGLGWIGRHCQLVSKQLGPWLRLGTVLCDAPLPLGRPVEKHRCGACRACVDACPAGALTGGDWRPGVDRSVLLDAAKCDLYKKTHFKAFLGGHNCGICTAACPVGQKLVKA